MQGNPCTECKQGGALSSGQGGLHIVHGCRAPWVGMCGGYVFVYVWWVCICVCVVWVYVWCGCMCVLHAHGVRTTPQATSPDTHHTKTHLVRDPAENATLKTHVLLYGVW